MTKIISLKDFSTSEIYAYFDELVKKYDLELGSEKARRLWLALFYRWKEEGDWEELDSI